MIHNDLPLSRYPEGEENSFIQMFFETLYTEYLKLGLDYAEMLDDRGITAVCSNISNRQLYVMIDGRWQQVGEGDYKGNI